MYKYILFVLFIHQILAETQFFLSYPNRKNWQNAFSECENKGYKLLSINTEEKATQVEDYLRKRNNDGKFNGWQNQIWTSGNRDNLDDPFIWKSTGDTITYSKWQIGEPSGKDFRTLKHENCLGLQHINDTYLEWNDVECRLAHYYVCEKNIIGTTESYDDYDANTVIIGTTEYIQTTEYIETTEYYINEDDEQEKYSKRTISESNNIHNILVQISANPQNERFVDSYPVKANWYMAMRICRSVGLDLVYIDSDEKQVEIENFIGRREIPQKHEIWTSGTDFGMNGAYYWMSNGELLTYKNWMPNEPSRRYGHTNENCIALRKTEQNEIKWNDAPCFNEQEFICEVIRTM